MHGKDEEAYAVLVRKPERKGSLGRHTCGWEDDISVIEIGCEVLD
jgi:hypothetical protein